MNTFIESAAASRETSIEVMKAILTLAGGDEKEAERIWGEPTDTEYDAVRVAVMPDGVGEFYWSGHELSYQ